MLSCKCACVQQRCDAARKQAGHRGGSQPPCCLADVEGNCDAASLSYSLTNGNKHVIFTLTFRLLTMLPAIPTAGLTMSG
jgi:hypothetical protein